MKKIKLITTLSSLGALTAATPIVATSCSNSAENYIVYNGEKISMLGSATAADILKFVPADYTDPTLPAAEQATYKAICIDGRYYDITKISELSIGCCEDAAKIPANFLQGCVSLKRLNLRGVKGVMKIGANFCKDCKSLGQLVLPTLRALTNEEFITSYNDSNTYGQLPDNFLYYSDCPSLTSVDFTGFANLCIIPDQFMALSPVIENVDLSPLKNVRSIGDNVLWECGNLRNIKLPNMKTLSMEYKGKQCTWLPQVGDNFLANNVFLNDVDFTPFAEVALIGDDFLHTRAEEFYISLDMKTVDMSKLTHVHRIGKNFLKDLSYVTTVKLPTMVKCDIEHVINKLDKEYISGEPTIGNYFLAKTHGMINSEPVIVESQIKNIDLTPLKALKQIPDGFLSGNINLEKIDLSVLANVEKIGAKFLSCCTSLKDVDFSTMAALQKVGKVSSMNPVIGQDLFFGCNSLTRVDMGDIVPANVDSDTPSTTSGSFIKVDWSAEEDPRFESIKLVSPYLNAFQTKFPKKVWTATTAEYFRDLIN